MHAESFVGRNRIIIENPQCTEVHILWIIVIREREEMLAREPGMFRGVAVFGRDDLDVLRCGVIW